MIVKRHRNMVLDLMWVLGIALAFLLLAISSHGQASNNKIQDSQVWGNGGLNSGTVANVPDTAFTLSNQAEVKITGTAPASTAISITGCMRGGTCGSILASTASVSSTVLNWTGGPWDNYNESVTWTGGDATTKIVINRTGVMAKNATSSGSSFPVTTAQAVTSGGSIVPSGTGTLVSNQDRWFVGAPQPSFTMSLTGGSFSSGHAEAVRISLVSPAGETLAGQELSLSNVSNGCTSGASCSITVTAPATPSGYTGYTVYQVDCSSTPCSGGELKVTTCVNITTNCTFGTSGSGAAPPTTNTAYPFPSPLGTNLCSPGTNPFLFIQDVNGTYYPYAGTDGSNTGASPPTPYNKLVFCRPFWYNDSAQDPPAGKNAAVLISHLQNGVTVNANNQDRGLAIFNGTCTPIGAQTCLDSGSHYGLEGIQVEQDWGCGPGCSINGSPDGEVTAGSFQLADYSSTNYTAPNSFGTNVLRLSFFKNGAGHSAGSVDAQSVINANYAVDNATFAAGAQAWDLNAHFINGVGGVISNLQWAAMRFAPASNANRPGNGSSAIYMQGGTVANAGTDFLFRIDSTGWTSYLNGPVVGSTLQNNGVALFPISASVTAPSFTGIAATAPSLTSVSCTGGASQYGYTLVGIDGNGQAAPGTQVTSGSTCLNPLTGGNPATVQASNAYAQQAIQAQFQRIDVYRTAGPMGLGKVGSMACSTGPATTTYCSTSFSDTGITATGTLPATNTTGSVGATMYTTSTNCAAVGTAASPSVASCTAAPAGSFSCATNASGATCTVNTTIVTANSEIFVQQRTDTTTGTRLGVTCNTTKDSNSTSPQITAVTAGTSFTIQLGTIATNPECFSYSIIN